MDHTRTPSDLKPAKFFMITLVLTWACTIPAGILSMRQSGFWVTALQYIGGAMPLIVTLIIVFFQSSPHERSQYWLRLIDFKRITIPWLLVILLTIPLLTGLSVLVDRLLGGSGADTHRLVQFIHQPLSIIPFSLFLFFFGPLPEEMAWRGYALHQLQVKHSALWASLMLGVFWIVWHLPLFLIKGSYQYGLGIGTPQFWLFILDKIPFTILLTWMVNNTSGSTASAVIFHFMINFVGELLDLTLQADYIYIALLWLMAFVVVIVWQPHNFVRKS